MPTVLIVDDSFFMRAHLRAILAKAGCGSVFEGTRGDELLPLYEAYRPDLVVLDIVMPGKDGVTAARELLERHPDAVVVMSTSVSSVERMLECRRIGVLHYLLKPVHTERTAAIVRSILGREAATKVRSAS